MATPTPAEIVAACDAALLEGATGRVVDVDGQFKIEYTSPRQLREIRHYYASLAARQSRTRPRCASIRLPGSPSA